MGRTSNARERLIDAAKELVWTHGYAAVGVDAICRRADVRPGSFYHFFKGKADLVTAAMQAHWESRRADMDRIFSPINPPLERVRGYFAFIAGKQLEMRARTGRIPGCLHTAVGSEVGCRAGAGAGCGTDDAPADEVAGILTHVENIIRNYCRYLESALKDAIAEGSIPPQDAAIRSQELFAYLEGVLTQARIRNSPELLAGMADGALRIIGAATPPSPSPPREVSSSGGGDPTASRPKPKSAKAGREPVASHLG